MNSSPRNDEYTYYNEVGAYIARSEGILPDQNLYEQAHYVYRNASEVVKNGDSLRQLQQLIKLTERELLMTPISDIVRIMELNQRLDALRIRCAEQQARSEELRKQILN